MSAISPKLLYLVTEDWYFCSHRLPLARAAKRAGFDVTVATRVVNHGDEIRDEGFDVVPISMRRNQLHPWWEWLTVRELLSLYSIKSPDLTHHVALKPVIYGSLAARLANIPVCVNALTGLGFVFTSRGTKARLLKPMVKIALGLAIRGPQSHVIVQNSDDRETVNLLGVTAGQVTTIKGSGIDLERYCPKPEPDGRVVVTLVSRMLWDKGIGEFIESARHLRNEEVDIQFRLVGLPDAENPASIREALLRQWADEGVIEWLGHRDDVPAIWADSHIAVLPSYREGMPKSLLEAAACGRPIVTTDVPGCRELVEHNVNGLLVSPRDSCSLTKAIARLAEDGNFRRRLGRNARTKVVRDHGEATVISQTLRVYETALNRACL